MKTLILAAIRGSLILTAVAALSVAYPAKATMFNVSGTCTPFGTFTGTTFSGTLTIDVTTGTLTYINVSSKDCRLSLRLSIPLQWGHPIGRS